MDDFLGSVTCVFAAASAVSFMVLTGFTIDAATHGRWQHAAICAFVNEAVIVFGFLNALFTARYW